MPTTFTQTESAPTITVGGSSNLSPIGLPAGATGTVAFTSNGTPLCTVTLPAVSCPTPTNLPVGSYPVTANYSGDGTFAGSTATNAMTLTVDPSPTPPGRVPTTFTQTESAASIVEGGSADLIEVGLPAAATGTVTFTSNGTTLCTVTLPATSCATPADLPVGTYPITATYSGDGNFEGSAAVNSSTLVVRPAPRPHPGRPPLRPCTGNNGNGNHSRCNNGNGNHGGNNRGSGVDQVFPLSLTRVDQQFNRPIPMRRF